MIVIIKGRKKFANYLNIDTKVYVNGGDELHAVTGISIVVDADKNIVGEYTLANGETHSEESLETEKARKLAVREESTSVDYVLDSEVNKTENTNLCAVKLGVTKKIAKNMINILYAEKMLLDAKAAATV